MSRICRTEIPVSRFGKTSPVYNDLTLLISKTSAPEALAIKMRAYDYLSDLVRSEEFNILVSNGK